MPKVPITFPSLSWNSTNVATLVTAVQQMFQRIAAAVNYPDNGASGAHPSDPSIGQFYWNTETDEPQWWNGSAWVGVGGQTTPMGAYVTSGGVTSSVATNTIYNHASINLPAGDWDVQAIINYSVPTTPNLQQAVIGVSTTPLDNTIGQDMETKPSSVWAVGSATPVQAMSLVIPPTRFLLTAPATVYLIGFVIYGGVSCTGNGRLNARMNG